MTNNVYANEADALEMARIKRAPIEPDEDGDCRRCGYRWDEEELSGAVEHECPPGFLSTGNGSEK
jgi:hypothetical protein